MAPNSKDLFQYKGFYFNIKRTQQGRSFLFRNNFSPKNSPNVSTFLRSSILSGELLKLREIRIETQGQNGFPWVSLNSSKILKMASGLSSCPKQNKE